MARGDIDSKSPIHRSTFKEVIVISVKKSDLVNIASQIYPEKSSFVFG
jgi:hypothetical protein